MEIKSAIVAAARGVGIGLTRKTTLDHLIERSRRLAELEDACSASATGSNAAMGAASVAQPAVPPPRDGSTGNDSIIADDLSAEAAYRLGMAARRAKDDDLAFRHFARALGLIPRYAPAVAELSAMSAACAAAADDANEAALPLLVRAIEMNPDDPALRTRLAALLEDRGGVDLTQCCFIFPDPVRARTIHAEAYRRALEFVTLGGVVGDVLEFGVLGGWSARIICETLRDLFNLGNVHLFDSFEGLPEYTSEVDRRSYEIGGRNIWTDKMRFPDDFLAQYGGRHDLHIRDRLSEIIRPERLFINRGFYAETLKTDLSVKASLVHIDCDLYQSTVEVLWGLHRMAALQDGCVLLFDDWNCNRANPDFGERRALREFLEGQHRFTASPWFTYGYNGAAFILHEHAGTTSGVRSPAGGVAAASVSR